MSLTSSDAPKATIRVPMQVGPAGVASSLLSPAAGYLAMEIAARLEPLATVLHRYALTGDQYRTLLKQEPFRQAIREASIKFASLGGTGERIKLKTQLLIELSLDEMWSIIGDSRQAASARVAAFSAIKSLTGLEKPEAAPVAQKFQLNITLPSNMSNAAPPLTIEGEAA